MGEKEEKEREEKGQEEGEGKRKSLEITAGVTH